MLHAPTNETKTKSETGKSPVPVPANELHTHFVGLAVPYSSASRNPPLAKVQAAYGNQAVLRRLNNPSPTTVGAVLQRKCACGGTPGPTGECAACRAKRLQPQAAIQPKLTIGAANDQYEQEADRVAEQVMRMPEPTIQRQVDLKAAEGMTSQTKQITDSIMPLQCSSISQHHPSEAPSLVHDVLRSSGQPLNSATRAFMEPRFGQNFSQVRVHTDAKAAESAAAVHALAYTVGRDMVFGTGQYAPETKEGQQLLAHELTHVVQQSPERVFQGAMDVGEPDNSYQRAATKITELQLSRQSATTVQRATRKGCIAPSFVVDVATASKFGAVAETLIEADYITQKGGRPFREVFLDNPLGPLSYVAFLVSHHPSLNKALLALQISLSGGVLVPDILDTRRASSGAPEFYDVKPNSPDGRGAGRAKLAAIDAFMSFNSLPYVRGDSYTPTPSIPIPLAPAILGAAIGPPALLCGLPIVTLAAERLSNGLLVYELCVEADLDCYLKVITLELLIALIIVAILASGGVLVPALAPIASADNIGEAGSGQALNTDEIADSGSTPDSTESPA